jgi:hypothetical protein
MTKEHEYRAYAGTCVDLANKAPKDEDKKHLLAMAEAWLGFADRVQRSVPEPVRCIRRFGQSFGGGLRFLALSQRPNAVPRFPSGSNGIEEYPAMTNGTDADFLQVLLGEVREDPLVDLVVAECRLVLFEAKA